MPVSDRSTEERIRARRRLTAMRAAPVTLERPVYFVPGWRDEHGSCWARMRQWLPHVIANHRTHVFFVEFFAPGGGPLPPWEDFLDLADDLAELIHEDVDGSNGRVDLVCHSMGGLDAVGAVALLDHHPELATPALACVHTVITYDTPFHGFGAAGNALFKRFVAGGRQDPWVFAQLAAMEKESKRIAEVKAARDEFLARVSGFWPRGADNYDGLLEVTHESASYGSEADLAPGVRSRHRGYRSWPDTTHSGPANGVTHDLRAVVETVDILTGQVS
jgi:hypothetical protein